jgi:hypothetical protein
MCQTHSKLSFTHINSFKFYINPVSIDTTIISILLKNKLRNRVQIICSHRSCGVVSVRDRIPPDVEAKKQMRLKNVDPKRWKKWINYICLDPHLQRNFVCHRYLNGDSGKPFFFWVLSIVTENCLLTQIGSCCGVEFGCFVFSWELELVSHLLYTQCINSPYLFWKIVYMPQTRFSQPCKSISYPQLDVSEKTQWRGLCHYPGTISTHE